MKIQHGKKERGKRVGIKIAIALVTILFLTSSVSAGLWDDFKDFIFNFFSGFIDGVAKLIQELFSLILYSIEALILYNPDPEGVRNLVRGFIQLLIPIYALAITISGIYLLFTSIAPAQRARAKSLLVKLIFSMILVSLSLDIFKILLGISKAISEGILAGLYISHANVPVATKALLGALFILSPLILLYLGLAALTVVALRALFVLLMAALFPFTLFLYFFDFTKDLGTKFMRYTLIWIFTQVVMAIILAVTITGLNTIDVSSPGGAMFQLFWVGAGFTLLIVAPLIMTGIMQWLGALVASVGMIISLIPGFELLGSALTFAGSVAAGMGAGSFVAAGGAYGLGRTFTRSLTPFEAARGGTETERRRRRSRRSRYQRSHYDYERREAEKRREKEYKKSHYERRKAEKRRTEKEYEKPSGVVPEAKGKIARIRRFKHKVSAKWERGKKWIISPGYQIYKRGHGRTLREIGGWFNRRSGGRLGVAKTRAEAKARAIGGKIKTRAGAAGQKIIAKMPERIRESQKLRAAKGKIKGVSLKAGGVAKELAKRAPKYMTKDAAIEAGLDIIFPGRTLWRKPELIGKGAKLVEKGAKWIAKREIRGRSLGGLARKIGSKGVRGRTIGGAAKRLYKGAKRVYKGYTELPGKIPSLEEGFEIAKKIGKGVGKSLIPGYIPYRVGKAGLRAGASVIKRVKK